MKKIWIDGYEANTPQRLGSSQVAFELLKNLEKIDQKNEYTILLPSLPLGDLPKEREGWRYQILRPSKLWTRIALPLKLFFSKEKPDLFFSPTQYLPFYFPQKVKKVMIVFDLAPLKFPELYKKSDLYKLINWTKKAVKQADHIITISNSSKEDIIKNYKIDKNKITVSYPGYNRDLYYQIHNKEKIVMVLNKYHLTEEYILFIGTIQPRKNLLRLINVFAEVIKTHPHLKLVIVGKMQGLGKEGWMFEKILAKPKQLGIELNVIFTGFVPDEDLPYLVSGAVAFILPSLWEGFGIPALEAMACGTPVIVSNVSSLPEVVGEAGLLINPYSEEEIAQAIRTVYTDKKLQQKLSKKGLEQVKRFSWEKMAKIVLKVFEEVKI